MYFAKKRTNLSLSEISSAFDLTNDGALRAYSKFSNVGSLKNAEQKCLRDLESIFQQLDNRKSVNLATSKGLFVELRPDVEKLLEQVHESHCFGSTLEETARVLLSYKLYEMTHE